MKSSVRAINASRTPLDCTVQVPGSKSIANRALVCAALSQGESVIQNIPDGDDTSAMLEALKAMGLPCQVTKNQVTVIGGDLGRSGITLNARLAGTTSRFLTAVAAVRTGFTTIDGDDALRRRPMNDLHDALRQLGANIKYSGAHGLLPVTLGPNIVSSGVVSIRGDISSQFISALMMIGPVIGGLTIQLTSQLVSRPYVDMTRVVMESFGARVTVSEEIITVHADSYKPTHFVVEPDFSSAAVPIVATTIRGGTIRLTGLGLATTQSDACILDIVQKSGAIVKRDGDDIVVTSQVGQVLQPLQLHLGDSSDLVPIVAMLCLRATGKSSIDGVGFIRAKESDRLGDLAREIVKLGGRIEVLPDGLEIQGVDSLIGQTMSTYDDHRLAMAFAVLGTVVSGISVNDSAVVSKSWPSFWLDMTQVLG